MKISHPVDKWLTAIWLIVNCKNGISSYEIARDLKVTQKSAWFMLHRIRLALKNGSWAKMGGLAAPSKWMRLSSAARRTCTQHASLDKRLKMKTTLHGYAEKAIVVGMLDRELAKFALR